MSQSLQRIHTWSIGGSEPEVRPTDTRGLNDTVQAATTRSGSVAPARDFGQIVAGAAVSRRLVRADDLEMFRFQLLGRLVPG